MSEHQTPGEILRAARELRGLEQSDIATRLRLSVQTIIDIENDDYQHFAAEIYLRGHMRSYARLVDVDSVMLFKSYEKMGIEIESDPQIPVVMSYNVSISHPATQHSKRKTVLWAGFGVLLILIVMVVLWWQEQRHHASHVSVQMTNVTKPAAISHDVSLKNNESDDTVAKKSRSKASNSNDPLSVVKR